MSIAYWTLLASGRQALLDCADKHRDMAAFTRAATLAWTQAQVQLHHLGVSAGEAALEAKLEWRRSMIEIQRLTAEPVITER